MEIEGKITDSQIYNEEIFVTERALAEIKSIKEKHNMPITNGLRVGVKGGGCSGLTYVLSYEEKEKEDDHLLEIGGQKIFIDQKSMFHLAGTTLDFTDGLNGRGFLFQNPQAKKTCGCGTSFGV
ncbi:MAG: iron-sulfur cluster assembly accessory protein [Bacteroidetes bacterium]|nr:iron-sulfur cluster assembly accessory protein [Bacteroidota bacterium]